MATIYKTGKKYRAQILVDGHRQSKTFDTKSEARTWAVTQEISIKENGINAPITFYELARSWVARYKDRVLIHKEAQRLEHLLSGWFGALLLSELNSFQVAKWRDERLKVNMASTVIRDMNLLASVCSMANKEMNLLAKNPFADIKRPDQPPSRDRIHTDYEMNELEHIALFRPSGGKALRMYKFACQTGMSAGEICKLEWSQIDTDKRIVTLPPFKTRPTRQVPLSKEAFRLLGEKGDGRVFELSVANLDANWRNLCKAASVEDLHFHDSRHYAATWLSKKLDPLALAKMLGHRDLKMLLNVYYKADAASLVDKLD